MKRGMFLTIFILMLSIFSCSHLGFTGNNNEVIDLKVNHYKQTRIGEGMYLSLMVQEGSKIGKDDWSSLGTEIEGFDFKPGYIYDLRVRKVFIENPPADGSSIKYILEKIKSTSQVSAETEFEIDLKLHGYNFVTEDSGQYSLLNQYSIICGTSCQELKEALNSEENLTGVFQHDENSSLKLIRF